MQSASICLSEWTKNDQRDEKEQEILLILFSIRSFFDSVPPTSSPQSESVERGREREESCPTNKFPQTPGGVCSTAS